MTGAVAGTADETRGRDLRRGWAMLSVKQAAERLGVSPSLVYALCRDGVIPHTRYGRPGKRGCIRIEEAALEAYRQTCTGEGRPPAAPPLRHLTA